MSTIVKKRKATKADAGIQSIEQVDQALRELAELDALEKRLQAKCTAECDRIKERVQSQMVVKHAGELVPIADRREQITTQVAEFCEARKDALLQGKAKSLKLTFGVIGWRSKPPTVVEDAESKTWSKHVDAIVAAIATVLRRLRLLPKVPAQQIVRVSVTPDKPALLKAFNAAVLTKADLKKLGFALVPGDEKFYLEPSAEHVRQPPEPGDQGGA